MNPTLRGAYLSDTGAFGTGGSGSATGTYIAGNLDDNEHRNFFVYDLGSVSGRIVQAGERGLN